MTDEDYVNLRKHANDAEALRNRIATIDKALHDVMHCNGGDNLQVCVYDCDHWEAISLIDRTSVTAFVIESLTNQKNDLQREFDRLP